MIEIIKDRYLDRDRMPSPNHQGSPQSFPLAKRRIFLVIAAACILLGLSFLEFRMRQLTAPSESKGELVVERGLGLKQAIDRVMPNAISPSGLLWLWARLHLGAQSIKAGVYPLEANMRLPSLLHRMAEDKGKPLLWQVREGQTLQQLRRQLAELPHLQHQSKDWPEAQLLQMLQMRLSKSLSANSLEGLFFADTYRYVPGMSDLELLALACQRQLQFLSAVWEQRPASFPLASPQELLVLASLVEMETGLDQDRARVAAVFLNRLRLGMRLQSDPTVIYGMDSIVRPKLSRKDLQTDHPHNTYTRFGLPPTPIGIPSKAALLASIKPSQETSLYFVAKGDGSSEFSETLAQHNSAVDRFIRKRKP